MKHAAEIRALDLPTISGIVKKKKDVKFNTPAKGPVKNASEDEEEDSDKTDKMTVKALLRSNTNLVTTVKNRLRAGRKQKFYYLTLPGIIRITGILFALLHIAVFGFYCTKYENVVDIVIPPFFLGNSREEYFLLVNYHTALGSTTIVAAGIFNSRSNKALLASLYPTIYDFIQFLSLLAASTSLIIFHRSNKAEILKVMPQGFSVKRGIAFSGVILSALHLFSTIYDLVVFLKRSDFIEVEGITIDEEGNLDENAVSSVRKEPLHLNSRI